MNEYEKDCFIDEDQLDEEWIQHPSTFIKYSLELADADIEKKEQKERVDYVKAELDRDIRKQMIESGEKITEKVVESRIILSAEYQTEIGILLDKERKCSRLSAAVKAMEHKKKALENLVQLWLASYFSTPKSKSKEANSDIATDRYQEKQRDALNNKRRKNGGDDV